MKGSDPYIGGRSAQAAYLLLLIIILEFRSLIHQIKCNVYNGYVSSESNVQITSVNKI